jgi:hypothetical protein
MPNIPISSVAIWPGNATQLRCTNVSVNLDQSTGSVDYALLDANGAVLQSGRKPIIPAQLAIITSQGVTAFIKTVATSYGLTPT